MDETFSGPVLESVTQQFVDEAGETFLALSPDDARMAFSRLQSLPTGKPGTQVQDTVFSVGPTGSVFVRIVRPREVTEAPPVVIYCHGGGWVAGDAETHDRLIREIAVGVGAAVVFVSYDRSPEARFPVAIEQVYAVLQYVVAHSTELRLDATRLAIVGDCAGGTLAAAVAILARERRGPKIGIQILICPVTDADFETPSYERFADGPWLNRSAMRLSWDAWLPDITERTQVPAAPLRASLDQLAQLPDTLVIVAENDVTRDEAEYFARRLSDAGVRVTSVRYNGTIHDFVVLNALADTPAARGAILQIVYGLRDAFG